VKVDIKMVWPIFDSDRERNIIGIFRSSVQTKFLIIWSFCCVTFYHLTVEITQRNETIIRTVLRRIVYYNCVQWNAHKNSYDMQRVGLSLDFSEFILCLS